MNEPTVNIDKFLGLRNKSKNRVNEVGSLVIADNVDIDDDGGIIIRKGYSVGLTEINITSSFNTHDERRAFIIESGDLYLLNNDLSKVLLHSGIGTDYIHWVEEGDFVILSSGHIIDNENNVTSWRIENPVSPNISVISGNLLEGSYRIVTTYIDSKGREGGASEVIDVELAEGSGLSIQPIVITGYESKVYLTDRNGSVFYLIYTGDGLAVVYSMNGYNVQLDPSQINGFQSPLDISTIAFYENKLHVCQIEDGISYIYFSNPFWWNLFNLFEDYISIDGIVNCLIGTPQGLIIGTDDQILLLSKEQSLVVLANYGCPKGIPFDITDNGIVYLWTKQGLCKLFPFVNLTEEKVSLKTSESVHCKIIQNEGFDKLITLSDEVEEADNFNF